MKSIIVLALLLISPFATAEDPQNKVFVKTIFEDGTDLLEELKLQGYIASFDKECCITPSDPEYEEAKGVWIGRQVSYLDVQKIVVLALQKYPNLSYFTFFEKSAEGYPSEWDRMIFIGGSKWAVYSEVQEVDSTRAKELFSRLSSQEELEQLLGSFSKRSDPEAEGGVH